MRKELNQKTSKECKLIPQTLLTKCMIFQHGYFPFSFFLSLLALLLLLLTETPPFLNVITFVYQSNGEDKTYGTLLLKSGVVSSL